MRAQSIKAYIRLLSGVTVSTSSPGFPRAERRARKLKLGTGGERKAQVGHDGNERLRRVFSAFSQSHLSIRPRFLNYQPKYPQNKRSPAIKDEVDFPLSFSASRFAPNRDFKIQRRDGNENVA